MDGKEKRERVEGLVFQIKDIKDKIGTMEVVLRAVEAQLDMELGIERQLDLGIEPASKRTRRTQAQLMALRARVQGYIESDPNGGKLVSVAQVTHALGEDNSGVSHACRWLFVRGHISEVGRGQYRPMAKAP